MRDKKRKYWLLWFIILVLSAYIVPYLFIGHIEKATASFLYWCLFALTAIISTVKITAYWRDK